MLTRFNAGLPLAETVPTRQHRGKIKTESATEDCSTIRMATGTIQIMLGRVWSQRSSSLGRVRCRQLAMERQLANRHITITCTGAVVGCVF